MKIWDAVKAWAEKHLVLLWAIASIVFAVVIHWLFKTPAPKEFFIPKWDAGDILTFVSTVALGLLAVWQNRKFKEENDELQNRMEDLTSKANELSIVSKIIEHESNSLSRLREKKNDFINACSTEAMLVDISDVATQPDDYKKLYVKIKMDAKSKQIKYATLELLLELKSHLSTDIINLVNKVEDYSNRSLDLVNEIHAGAYTDDVYNQKTISEKACINEIADFMWKREKMLNKVIYTELSLEEIKMMYYIEFGEENIANGENANGIAGHDSAEHR